MDPPGCLTSAPPKGNLVVDPCRFFPQCFPPLMKRALLSFILVVLPAFGALAQHEHASTRPIEFPDVDGYETLKVDLHIHTVFSDGSVWPTIRVEEAIRDGLDAVAITDHLEYQPHQDDIPHPDRNRSYEIALESAQNHDLIVINGSEITRSMPPGHSNAVFVQDANPLLQDDVMAVFREAKRQGAFTFWNHPMWTAQNPTGITSLTDMHRTLIQEGLLDGIEVVNQHTYSAEALQVALDHNLTILGTSDIHGLVDWEFEVPHGGHRPITLAFVSERSKSGLQEALEAGRTAVWYDNLLIGREEHVTPLLDASLRVEGARYLEDTSVLEVSLRNTSDAAFILDRQSAARFHTRSDVITIHPHETTQLQVKPGERVDTIELRFDVLNAIVAPESHPSITFEVDVGDASNRRP